VRVITTGRPDTMAVQRYDIPTPSGGFEQRAWSPINTPVFDDAGAVQYVLHRVEDVTQFVTMSARASDMEVEIIARSRELQDANRELRKLQAELEQRVEERTRELSLAHAALGQREEQLRQAQKLEAIGRLAGGVAHDFNNLLSVILSYAEVSLSEIGPDDPTRPSLVQIVNAGRRAAELTKQLLAFSRRQVLELRILDVRAVFESMFEMLMRLVGEDIEFTMFLAHDLGRVRADSTQLEQVVMNLVINARDSMPRGGNLAVRASNATLGNHEVGELPAGRYVLVSVRDEGAGMDASTVAHAFEPFFTTKERGRGTGLGLSTVFGIVNQCGGHVAIDSKVGVGTTVHVYLPIADAVATVRTPPRPRAAQAQNDETILLTEDQENVREIATNVLRRAGYVVIPCASPIDALAILERGARVDLLLTDVVMPKMNGRELAERARIQRPLLKVLFMSGYADDIVLEHAMLSPNTGFMDKPLTPEKLTQKVRALLDE
jgi:two-component system cell cycle sensor histidine kinase/response regulator CckA